MAAMIEINWQDLGPFPRKRRKRKPLGYDRQHHNAWIAARVAARRLLARIQRERKSRR
jgi:hypothetical protein